MARIKGTANFSGTIEPLAGGALDARDIAQTKADLTANGSFPYPYIGMETYVVAEDKKYRLIGADPTVEDNWKEVGSGGGVAHAGFTPVGTVISVMGNTAPANYLTCDGQTVNIADYRELADYFEAQFGTKNHFGGDGTTTFAVPDLRGEFLRGTGTNSHENQGNGADVGAHQDGTVNVATPIARDQSNNITLLVPINNSYISGGSGGGYDYFKEINVDKTWGRTQQGVFNASRTDATSGQWSGQYISRPTNTSVLYCIATKNIYIDARYDYSADEKVVGTWIDGKPIYQKTVDCGALPNATTKLVAHGISNFDHMVGLEGYAHNGTTSISIPYISTSGTDYAITIDIDDTNINIITRDDRSNLSGYITIRYAKTTDAPA